MTRPHRPIPETDKVPPGTESPPVDDAPVKRPGPDPDDEGEALDT